MNRVLNIVAFVFCKREVPGAVSEIGYRVACLHDGDGCDVTDSMKTIVNEVCFYFLTHIGGADHVTIRLSKIYTIHF